ncbi:hypothetical protein [Ammonifex thiophilus]|uniref:hypothetical protein n=1 Tax=Ammonifex thiophilus TaxID=444093 RepID=UPI0014037DED|nr:hypothetical protein [Ammonifex thiophilus]
MTVLENLLREIDKLSAEEVKELYQALIRKMAVSLKDPREFYDDWDDPEVDRAYASVWN